ncbi:phosphotransferase enzyme family protein [Cohnella sp.]|uniref:phosphotransferase enzyme family protein n=1 Tax=Cohnella sp. TaxID=1883426 RepID=UPI0037039C27
MEWERIQFVQLSDTITYKIETNTAGHYLLRIHSGRLSREEIRSELLWLQALNESHDLIVPEGIANAKGAYVMEIETESGPTWGIESFRRDMAKLERYYERFLSEEGWTLYQAAAEKVVSRLTTMHPNEHNYGLIHADLHSGNMVFKEDQPYPIDFGRCGYGYYLYDMAGTLLELWPKHRWMLIQGYESVRKLEPEYVRDLECFFVMFMIENYGHHVSDPRETASLMEEQQYAQAYIREFLADRSFLFEVIEPV